MVTTGSQVGRKIWPTRPSGIRTIAPTHERSAHSRGEGRSAVAIQFSLRPLLAQLLDAQGGCALDSTPTYQCASLNHWV